MSLKILALALLAVIYCYKLCIHAIETKSFANPIPESVSDIYDAETYTRWRRYAAEKQRWSLLEDLCSFIVIFVLILSDAFAGFANWIGGNIYVLSLSVTLLSTLTDAVIGCLFGYVDTMKVEQKYGFNNTTGKTFAADQIKQLVIALLLNIGLTMLLAGLHRWLGDYLALAFAIVLFVIILLISCLFPFLPKSLTGLRPLMTVN